ncbi:vWA domain-containing protein [Halorarius halobius]|uniref:vWA domain-containing protein n=1 Tax=Halorarius halobius TaxID=2962671 RepID=UPI0020CB7664|nr:vWA domain-containing protein [Halorarius halobius]
MTTTTTTLYPLSRRSMLKGAAAVGAASALGTFGPSVVGRAAADSHAGVIETCGDLDVVLALDYSGSIRNAGTWPDIQSGVESFFDVFPADAQVGLVTFGDSPVAYEYAPGDLLRLATASNVSMVKGGVPANAPPGENATHMPGALAFADAILANEGRGGKEVIVLVTDGGPNYQNGFVGDGDDDPGTAGFQGPADDVPFPYGSFEFTGGTTGGENGVAGEAGELTETTATATAITDGGVRIIAVGVGGNVAGFDTYLRDDVASSPDDFVAVENAEDLGSQLQALLTEVCEEECDPCAFDGTYKFEYEYEEEDGVVVTDGFAPEGGSVDGIDFESYISKAGEMYEPISVTFASDYCADSLVATVKAGREVHEVDVQQGDDGTVVVSIDGDDRFRNSRNGKAYAISYVQFDCVAADAGN